MYKNNLLENSTNRKVILEKGKYQVLEYEQDMSVNKETAMTEYFASKMNVRKRQVLCNLNNNGVVLQAGAMQVMFGNIEVKTNVSGVGDFFKKALSSSVTGESAIKPKYQGTGQILLEPSYKYILVEDLKDWNGSMTIDDGLFLGCDDTVNIKTVARRNLSSAVLGGEGLFNTSLTGTGVVVLESKVPYEELVVVELNNDTVKIDGNMAIAWSSNLSFTVEKTTKTLIGSAASGEGFVNVFRGTGKVLIALV